ncbi:MAG: hypothetical protein N3F07_02975 [Candidatus Micrarchaeota archaeon]|nr:hypothetical protein [Candidatus Micrarchaeota archaeon]
MKALFAQKQTEEPDGCLKTAAKNRFIYRQFRSFVTLRQAREMFQQAKEAADFVERLYQEKLPDGCKVKTEEVLDKKTGERRLAIAKSPGFAIGSEEVSLGARTSNSVHELTHIMDHHLKIHSKEKPERAAGMGMLVEEMYFEGRATFAQKLYDCAGKWDYLRAKYLNAPFISIAAGISALSGWKISIDKINVVENLRVFLDKNIHAGDFVTSAIETIALNLAPMIAIPLLAAGTIYWTFHRGICNIAKQLGDPRAAFNITAKKVPKTFSDLLFPLKFYRQEIENEKNGEKVGKA